MSISLYTSIILLVNIKLALNTQFWFLFTWVAFIVTSVGAYFVYIWISDIIIYVSVYKTLNMLFSTSIFYTGLALSILSMFALDLTMFSFKFTKSTLLNYLK